MTVTRPGLRAPELSKAKRISLLCVVSASLLLAACGGGTAAVETNEPTTVARNEAPIVEESEPQGGDADATDPAIQDQEFDPAAPECPEDYPVEIDADGNGVVDGCSK